MYLSEEHGEMKMPERSMRGNDLRARRLLKWLVDRKGNVLPIVLAILSLMVLGTVNVITVIQRDAAFVQRVRVSEQARMLAEAGLADAFARLKASGGRPIANFTGTLDTGSYSVAFTAFPDRAKVTSRATVSGITSAVSAEIVSRIPTALNYFSGAGKIMLRIQSGVDAVIEGDIHANNDVIIECQPHASMHIAGNVSATGIVQEGLRHYDDDNKDDDIYINGINNDGATVYEGARRITFPFLDYAKYRQDAIDSGDYYDSDQTFTSTSLNPANGVVYVDGKVTINGICDLTGTLIADSVYVLGTLRQYDSPKCDMIVAKSGDIMVTGRLEIQNGIAFAAQDIISYKILEPQLAVNGILLALRNIDMWNFKTFIDFRHVYMIPDYMTEESTGFVIVSYNE